MHFYWEGKEGELPPPKSQFFLTPFASSTPSPLQEPLLFRPLPAPLEKPLPILKATFSPDRKGWILQIEKALEAIEQGRIDKIVLARRCTLELPSSPSPFEIAATLRKKKEGAALFCLEGENLSLFGASPERLFRREGRRVIAESVGGTRKRGKTEEEDRALGQELLRSPKDLLEHQIINQNLREVLSPFCHQGVASSPLQLKTTPYLHHLFQEVAGELKEGVDDLSLIRALHPTPALGGAPKSAALSLLSLLEPFERGLYGGVFGWKSEERSEWHVLIRSGFIEKNKVILTTGTGIVAGSDPEKEWEELNLKLSLYCPLIFHFSPG